MKIVFSDFDGTLTCNGKLSATFFDILKLIKDNNSELIIVSGRSLSWGHFFLTHFDVNYCIMEGGGVIVYKDASGNISERNLISGHEISQLEQKTKKLCAEVKGVVLSADSLGRRTDRAVEFFQMQDEPTKKMLDFLTEHDLNFTKSNVHINFWQGNISKANGVMTFLKEFKPALNISEVCFFGDAMNDESMFELFPNTIGVSNILEVLPLLKFKPKLILEGKQNAEVDGVYNHLKKLFKP